MKSQVQYDQEKLAEYILEDAHARCSVFGSLELLRDVYTLRKRVEKEGISFLTITLPNFCKDFERSLELGFVDPTFFQGFEKNGAIPSFLKGMLGQLFDRSTGKLFEHSGDSPNVQASTIVESIRQVCLAFKKVELECTPLRTYRAISSFVQTEQELSSFKVSDEDRFHFRKVASILWDPIVSRIKLETLVPRHGPGTTSEGISGNQKYLWKFWHERLEPFFGFVGSAYTLGASDSFELEQVTFLPPDKELPCKVVPVPKTLKAPRIIAIEPCCNQFVQQAIRSSLYSGIELGRFVAGQVNFTDQSINQSLAMKSSKDGSMATLDLSDASDRVLLDIASCMFDSHPDLRDAILACRSTHASLPDGRIIGPLLKFASMGNALTFPVESMYFYTICVATLLRERELPVTITNVKNVSSLVYVYGDDLVVPAQSAETIVDGLQRYNCKVNTAKSFWTGKFRESCGVDAYDGMLVTPTYIRNVVPHDRRNAASIISLCATANQLKFRGFDKSADYLFMRIERLLGPLPIVEENSPAVGRISWFGSRLTVDRFNGLLQRTELRGWVPSPVNRTDSLTGYAALSKSLNSIRLDPYGFSNRDPLHLERSARSGTVSLKRRWVPTLS